MVYSKRSNYNPNMRAVHTHSPTTIEYSEDITYSISKEGKVTIQVYSGDGNEEYDEVIVPASLIFKIREVLNTTRTTKLVPKEEKDASDG